MAEDSLRKGRYTRLSNKIGLVDSKTGGFINNSPEVILNFPFKDTVLEAGMTKEDAGREERFLHTEIDAKDIDTLFDPKVLTDFRCIDKDGERKLTKDDDIEFFDENGDLKQNLLIKGNNLLALHTLHEKLAGKVKLIYIDPPYNTENDSFKYNDNFNHSAWLTFMKNRLEVAKELLSHNGSIWIQCDDNEQAYLKVLMDEIFGMNCFVNCICVKMSETTGVKMSHVEKKLPKTKEYILMYKKNNLKLNNVKVAKEKWDNEYKILIKGLSKEELNTIKRIMYSEENNENDIRKCDNLLSKIEFGNVSELYSSDNERDSILFENAWRICRDVAVVGSAKKIADKKREVAGNAFLISTSEGKKYLIKNGYNKESEQPRIKLLFADNYLTANPCDLWIDIKTTGLENEGTVNFKNGKKPEKLIERVLEYGSEENDIILDFCLGSGTTAAVAHKMHRKWIAIEQMDYIETKAKKRLQNVISGEQSGISKNVNWQGGGSFVYFELKKYNQDFIDRIMEAASIPELEEIYEDMQKNAFLKFWFDKKEFEKDEKFRKLDIDGRKQALVDILDENQFYLNYDEMEDSKYHVTEDEKALTNRFYQESDKPEELENAKE